MHFYVYATCTQAHGFGPLLGFAVDENAFILLAMYMGALLYGC